MSEDTGLPPETGPERTCIVTRRKGEPGSMLRFVRGPDGAVVFDGRRRLPGRGAWVDGEAPTLAAAVKRKAFSRAFKREVMVAPDLVDQVGALLERDALQSLALANKAGRLVCGSAKIQGALAEGGVVALLHATGASPDGSRKIEAAARRLAGPEKAPPPVVEIFESHQMDLALGRVNVIHAALLIGGASDAFMERAARLSRFRGSTPRGSGESRGEPLPIEHEVDAVEGETSDGG